MRGPSVGGDFIFLVVILDRKQPAALLLSVLAALVTPSSPGQSVARLWNEELLAAIRLEIPNPPRHARNLFHTAVVMYDAWAAYDSISTGYLFDGKIQPLPPAIEAAREEAISYAAYRLLRARLISGNGAATTLPRLDSRLTGLGYSPALAQAPATTADSPAELGKRIADAILSWSGGDRFSLTGYPEPYGASINPNVELPMNVLGTNLGFQINVPLGMGLPAETDPNFWQPLHLSASISQNGLPLPGGTQPFLGVQSLATVPFALSRTAPTQPWLDPYGGPSRLATETQPSASSEAYKLQAMAVIRTQAALGDETLIDISPGAGGNNSLGSNDGGGFTVNPVTGTPYAGNWVSGKDFGRVLAEYWADGPNSETPPGHWHALANAVSDSPLLEKRIGGAGPLLGDLEWDVKLYFALGAACHDAACAAWSLKRYYSSPRPITMIRYMASMGQSSDAAAPSYHFQGIPLEEGLVELVTPETTAAGGRHEQIWDMSRGTYRSGGLFLNQIVIRGWPGEHLLNPPPPAAATHQSTIRWMRGIDWVPFQRKTFNTPAFPGYVSGHSCFSRAAAEVLTAMTGSPFFPGGYHDHTFAADSMQIDLGPSTPVTLQWCRYFDAADEAGQSRIRGGIHIEEDDLHGRIIGAEAGQRAYALAAGYWNGSLENTQPPPTVTLQPDGGIRLEWRATRGKYYRLQRSENLRDWEDLTADEPAYDETGTFTDTTPPAPRGFYRFIHGAYPASP
jgi:hypothetical protein